MADAEGVVLALAALRKTRNAAVHAQPGHAGAAAGEHLVRVGLVADVPHQAIVRGVEDVVQGDRQFDRAEVRREVSAGPGDRFRPGRRATRRPVAAVAGGQVCALAPDR
jgi:hypothetical protein